MRRIGRILGLALVVAAGFICGRLAVSLVWPHRLAPVAEPSQLTIPSSAETVPGEESAAEPGSVAAPSAATHPEPDGILARGEQVYQRYCIACHLANGEGNGMQEPLPGATSLADPEKLLLLTLGGSDYLFMTDGAGDGFLEMPGFPFLDDAELAAVSTYLRAEWLDPALPPITVEEAAAARATWDAMQ